MKFYHQYDRQQPKPRTYNDEPSQTQQHFKDECDVNHIIDKFTSTGELLHVRGAPGLYADVGSATDYQDLMNNLRAVQGAFEGLPEEIQDEHGSAEAWLHSMLKDPDEGVSKGGSERSSEGTGEVPEQGLEEPALDTP